MIQLIAAPRPAGSIFRADRPAETVAAVFPRQGDIRSGFLLFDDITDTLSNFFFFFGTGFAPPPPPLMAWLVYVLLTQSAAVHDIGERRVHPNLKAPVAHDLGERSLQPKCHDPPTPCVDPDSTTTPADLPNTTGRYLARRHRRNRSAQRSSPAARSPFGSASAVSTAGNGLPLVIQGIIPAIRQRTRLDRLGALKPSPAIRIARRPTRHVGS